MAEPALPEVERLPPSPLGAEGQLVMRVIMGGGPNTRQGIARRTGLTEAAASSVAGELERAGWIQPAGEVRDDTGQPEMSYQLAPRSAAVIGMDIGGTKIRAAVADLRGDVIAERVEPTCQGNGAALADQLNHLCRGLAQHAGIAWQRIAVVAAGTPGFLDSEHGQAERPGNVPELASMNVPAEFTRALGKEVLVENDVNMAAIGEHWLGHGRGLANVCLISVGTGLGMGIIIDGQLRRGSRGGAGEIGYLPIVGDPFSSRSHGLGALEEAAAGVGIAARYQHLSGIRTTVADVVSVFEQAGSGNKLARTVVDEEARLLALIAASVAAVLDPELIVFGGGIGSQDSLIQAVSDLMAQNAGPRPAIKVALLGARAGLIGAIGMALRRAHRFLFAAPDSFDEINLVCGHDCEPGLETHARGDTPTIAAETHGASRVSKAT